MNVLKPAILFSLAAGACPVALQAYEVHEWGTFTTVAGSDGTLLAGLEREEEHLPAYVHSHFGFENGQACSVEKYTALKRTHGFASFNGTKGLGERPVAGVTVKMETPVIYFYSAKALRVQVKVGFTGGTISQWYPERSGGEVLPEPPPPGKRLTPEEIREEWKIDFNKPYRGGIEWNVEILSAADSKRELLFKPGDTLSWQRARVPEANVMRTAGGETEGYLFYRGLGNFQPAHFVGLHTRVSADETLHLRNQAGGKIPYLLVYEGPGAYPTSSASWKAIPEGLEEGASLDISALTPCKPGFPKEIYNSLQAGLKNQGLTDSEAHAMVQTWWDSYFAKPGLRVFWVLPDGLTSKILPLEITPKPQKLVRVLVGRSEVLRPRQEKQWMAWGPQNDEMKYLIAADRFGLAIQERLTTLKTATAGK